MKILLNILNSKKQKSIIDNFYPNINFNVVKVLGWIIKDEEIPSVSNGINFVIRFPLTKENDIITDKTKIH